MLFLIASVSRSDGPGGAVVRDCVDADFAARTFGLPDHDVYVTDPRSPTVFRNVVAPVVTELSQADVDKMHAATP